MNRTKWEYRIVSHEKIGRGSVEELQQELDKLGNMGWELVTAKESLYIFKRPVPK